MGWLVITLALGGMAAIYGFLKRVNHKYGYSSFPLDDLSWGSSFVGNICTFLKALSCVGDSPNSCCNSHTDVRYISTHTFFLCILVSVRCFVLYCFHMWFVYLICICSLSVSKLELFWVLSLWLSLISFHGQSMTTIWTVIFIQGVNRVSTVFMSILIVLEI